MDSLATVLVLMSTGFLFVYSQTEPWALVTLFIKALLVLATLTFVIQFLGKRLKRLKNILSRTQHIESGDNCSEQKSKEKKAYTEKIQKDFTSKAEDYKERILKPREEAKRKQKEEEYYRFLGPAWKGKGDALGGPARESQEETEAIRLNRLQEHINEDLREQVLQEREREARRKQRKKIVLPDEPVETDPECILIILRSPLGQTHQRRFTSTHTLQIVMDYMTTLGFSQKRYTLCTSYPREALSDKREMTLRDLNFTKRTILNVEELE